MSTEMTDRRQLLIKHDSGTQTWVVNEFNGGQRFMLVLSGQGFQFAAHLDSEQWADFQRLVAGDGR